jgi:16S rRNA (cytidine1402-2'-O)-methyltransferase
LAAGEVVALVSDAGTPAISDPGFRLAAQMRAAGHPVTACPGANAAITGLILSGAPTNRFLFVGFLPSKSGGRAKTLQEIKTVPATQIFYESPKRLAQSLAQMAEILGDRPGAVCRELTKKFEEVRQGTLQELADHYQAAGAPKGEIVIVAGPPLGASEINDEELSARLEQALAQDSLKDAVAQVVEETGLPRKRVYKLALDLKSAKEE